MFTGGTICVLTHSHVPSRGRSFAGLSAGRASSSEEAAEGQAQALDLHQAFGGARSVDGSCQRPLPNYIWVWVKIHPQGAAGLSFGSIYQGFILVTHF